MKSKKIEANLEKNILQNAKERGIVRIIVSGIIILCLYFFVREYFGNVDSITKFAQASGIFGPIVFVILMSLGILLTPIPSSVLIIAIGYLYGVWIGAICSYIGHLLAVVSSYAVFKKIKGEETGKYKKYEEVIHKNKKLLYLLYAMPIIPISVITLIASKAKLGWRKFTKIILISFIPNVLFFSFIGNRISHRNLVEIIILITILTILSFIILVIVKRKQKSNNSNQN